MNCWTEFGADFFNVSPMVYIYVLWFVGGSIYQWLVPGVGLCYGTSPEGRPIMTQGLI